MNEIKKIVAPKKPKGRPKIELNLVELERLSTLNCTMEEIALFFDVPLRTLEHKYTHEPEVRKAIDKGRASGKLSLRRKQIQIMDESNNATMAIWLGKQILGQTDKQEITQDINIEERKVLDLSKLSDNELNTIERALKYAVVEPSESREDETLPQVVHKGSMANNRAK